MNAVPANRTRAILTVFALMLELAHLAWEHFNGGVVAHHLLNRADMPAISNWWGVLVIPALTWSLTGLIQRRISKRGGNTLGSARLGPAVLAGLFGALAYGAVLAIAFTLNHAALTYIFLALFAISVIVPAYRAEYVLGFVLAMTFTFGAVLPAIMALVIASFSRLVHSLSGFVWRLIRHGRSPRPLPRNY
ncbi:hypothetical protein [Massilia polaris]|uniref:hypothetical protein n=1 Tax=Massilia polaris TaxID=2728846 RepID=UPI001980966E|nr:hypothetical protein [Massilia polaris]